MDNEIRGYTPTIIILDDFSGLEDLMAQFYAFGLNDVVCLGHLDQISPTKRLADIVEMQMVRFPVEAEPYDIRDRDPLPRPSRAPVRVNQASKQSFRKTMRSVNRNR